MDSGHTSCWWGLPFLLIGWLLPHVLPATGAPGSPGGLLGQVSSAVVVGVSDYQDAAINDLRYAASDAARFADFLRSGRGAALPGDRLQLLTDSLATLAAIQSALARQLRSVRAGEVALIYLAGHGDVESGDEERDGYVLVHDTPPNNYTLTALSVDYLNDHLQLLVEAGARPLLVIDACHAGTLAGSDVSGRTLTARQLMVSVTGELRIVACQPYELAHEGREWGGGVFSHYLLRGLGGLADANANQEVDLFELEGYLQREVHRDTDAEQHPELTGGRMGEALLVLPDAAAETVRTTVAETLEEDFERRYIQLSSPEVQREYVRFRRALDQGKLLRPEGKSAIDHYRTLRASTSQAALGGLLDERMTVALLDSVQQAIRDYLDTDANELLLREQLDDRYRIYPQYLSAAAQIVGENDPRYPSIRAKQRYFEGLVLRLAGDRAIVEKDTFFRAALEKIRLAIAAEPNAAYLHNEYGLLHLRLDDISTAYASFLRAIELAATWALPYNNLGSLLKRVSARENFPYIQDYYERAIRLKPNFATAYMNYGNLLFEVGRPDTAEVLLRQALELGEDYVDVHYNLGALLCAQEGREEEASRCLREVLRRSPDDPDAWLATGTLHQRMGRPDSARLAFTHVLDRDPYSLKALYLLRDLDPAAARQRLMATDLDDGPVFLRDLRSALSGARWTEGLSAEYATELSSHLYEWKAYEEAERGLEAALTKAPDNPDGYLTLATFHTMVGKPERALRVLRRLLGRELPDGGVDVCARLAANTALEPLRTSGDYEKLIQQHCKTNGQ